MVQKFDNFNIDSICKKYNITNYTINPDGSIDVDEDVYLYNKNLDKLPLKFNRVSGYFYCDNNNLTNLIGAPQEVRRDFYCHNNNLTSLIGAPKYVEGGFSCYNNKLTNLVGAPQEVGGYFYCDNNNLTNLIGAPQEVGGSFYCKNNPLPQEIYVNFRYIKNIIELQDLYSIWRRDGSFNKFHFDEMMIDIRDIK